MDKGFVTNDVPDRKRKPFTHAVNPMLSPKDVEYSFETDHPDGPAGTIVFDIAKSKQSSPLDNDRLDYQHESIDKLINFKQNLDQNKIIINTKPSKKTVIFDTGDRTLEPEEIAAEKEAPIIKQMSKRYVKKNYIDPTAGVQYWLGCSMVHLAIFIFSLII